MARSNRQLTQLAVDQLRYTLECGPKRPRKRSFGNTEIEVVNPIYFVVRLFGKDIMRAYFNAEDQSSIFGIRVNAGDFYDNEGRPSRTTRERINGLLDCLGSEGVVPEGVRVFFDISGTCWIGKGNDRRRLDASNTSVDIIASPNVVNFAS